MASAAPEITLPARRSARRARSLAGQLVSLLTRFVVSLWALVTLTFLMVQLVPGDPVRAALGMSATQEDVRTMRHQLHLDESLVAQYGRYLRSTLSGDFGESIVRRIPTSQIIDAGLWNTVSLVLAAFAITLVVAIPLGSIGAAASQRHRRRTIDATFTGTTAIGASVPEIVLAVGLVYVLAVSNPWLPIAGKSGLSSYVIPALSLSVAPAMMLARVIRAEGRSVLTTEYIRTARAKRLSDLRIHGRHVLPNVMPAGLTVGALLLGGMLASTVLIETVYSWPGLAMPFVQAIQDKDYPVVQGIAMVYGSMVLLLNLLVDLVLTAVDPRTRENPR
ncbi:ABC transporter permease [Nonomuraea sp. B12E4]|uniref:ABC transporter permease n=1 Tax=Nonomuraea sp. B12E4 TaxID=3153564 RepID=UPI00325D935B